jgi:hypothetical protein
LIRQPPRIKTRRTAKMDETLRQKVNRQMAKPSREPPYFSLPPLLFSQKDGVGIATQ